MCGAGAIVYDQVIASINVYSRNKGEFIMRNSLDNVVTVAAEAVTEL